MIFFVMSGLRRSRRFKDEDLPIRDSDSDDPLGVCKGGESEQGRSRGQQPRRSRGIYNIITKLVRRSCETECR